MLPKLPGSKLCLAVLILAVSTLVAHGKSPAQNPPAKAQPPAEVNIPHIAEPLRLSDFAGMQPRPDLKNKLLRIADFIQNSPSDGKPATESTEVYLGYTKTTLYVVFLCHDSHPTQVRGHLARRENILSDDNVSILLDPFHDRRKGVMFSVNPIGVQADASWAENTGPDYSYDQVWDSEGHVTKDGWMALMAIPFRSLRFRPGASNSGWGVVLMRSLPRNSESDYWPRVAANVTGVLSQEAVMQGIQGVTPSRNIQLNPYALAQNERTLKNIDPTDPYFSSRGLEGTAGGEVKAILKDSIVFDGTINPDFSDIESDQPQFTVDQRYPVYFPELRPFFLENANYFATPIQLLYTRNIVHPEFGGRVTGKIDQTNVGLLFVDDREPGQTVAPGDPLYKKRALFAVGRASQDLGKGSSVGAIYTDEEFGDGWNRIGGIDYIWRINEKWTSQGQWVESSTKGNRDSGTPPTYYAGPASYLDVTRNGHSFNMFSNYQDFSTGFQSQVGFIQTTDIHNGHTHATYQWFPKSKVLQSFGLEANQNLAWDHQGNRVYRYSNGDPFLLLSRSTVIAPIGGQNSDTVGPQNGYPLDHSKNFTENFGGLVARSAPFSMLNFSLTAIRGGNVNYNPVAGQVPFLLTQQFTQFLFTLQPLRQLTADNTYLLDRDHAAHGGELVYESQKFRTKINYQFTRALSARVIVEYDSTLANPRETSLQRTKQIGTEALLTWLPHPGTAIYIGYNNDLQNLSRELCNRLPNGSCDPNNTVPPTAPGYLNDGRQIFLKASYLFRF